MNLTKFAIAALCCTINAFGASIIVDIGPSRRQVEFTQYSQYIVPFEVPFGSLDGQTVSLEFSFADGHFVRLYPSTSRSFSVAAALRLFGDGAIWNGPFSAYTFDANGVRNSEIWASGGGGGVITHGPAEFNFGLGYVYPVLRDTSQTEFDFYGMRIDVTLPSSNFQIVGGSFRLTPHGSQWGNIFGVGPHVPDTGSTLPLFVLGLVSLAAMKWRACLKS